MFKIIFHKNQNTNQSLLNNYEKSEKICITLFNFKQVFNLKYIHHQKGLQKYKIIRNVNF